MNRTKKTYQHRKIAVITGVSRLKGIGRAICLELAQHDIDIFFTYWTTYDNQMPWKVKDNEPDLIQQEVLDLGVRCKKIELDLSKENATTALLDAVEGQLGSPTILINNATYSTQTDIDNFSAGELDKHYAVNIRATTLLTMAFIRRFTGKNNGVKHGRIINLTSGQSLGPMPDEIAYAITKGAIETLTYTLSQRVAAKGITINAVNPGPNDTGWMDAETKDVLQRRFPMGRIGIPKDTAKLIAFLAGDDACWITGQIIHSEGGFIR